MIPDGDASLSDNHYTHVTPSLTPLNTCAHTHRPAIWPTQMRRRRTKSKPWCPSPTTNTTLWSKSYPPIQPLKQLKRFTTCCSCCLHVGYVMLAMLCFWTSPVHKLSGIMDHNLAPVLSLLRSHAALYHTFCVKPSTPVPSSSFTKCFCFLLLICTLFNL